MNYSKPTLIVLSGPNGAGKSTHAQSMLPSDFEGMLSFDRDKTRTKFEEELKSQSFEAGQIFVKANAMMEKRLVEEMRWAIGLKHHFVLETPLSHPDYWAYIDLFENSGYQI